MSNKPWYRDIRKLIPFIVIATVAGLICQLLFAAFPVLFTSELVKFCIIVFISIVAANFSCNVDITTDKYLGVK